MDFDILDPSKFDLGDGINTVGEYLLAGLSAFFAYTKLRVLWAKDSAEVAGAETGKAAAENWREEIERLIGRNKDLEERLAKAQSEVATLREELATLRGAFAEFKASHLDSLICGKANCPNRKSDR